MIKQNEKKIQGVLFVQTELFKLLDSLMFQGLCFLKICHGKSCFANYVVNKRTLTLKKQVASPER